MHKSLLVASVLAAAASACTESPPLDREAQPIIGGRTVPSSEFPSVVALENGPGNWFCTGTLIHEQWVLTAAHCVEGETAGSLKIRFDDANVNDTSGGSQVAVAAIHAHPGYDGVSWDNDIAVVELAVPQPGRVVTPLHRASPPPGTPAIQVGYGDADDNGGGSGLLRAADNTTIDCADAGDPEVSAANLLCFTPTTAGTGTCYGDSGGPSFVAGPDGDEVAGVTSGGTVDSCLSGYDLETLVLAEIDFIDQYVPLIGPVDPIDPTDPDPTDPTDPDPTDPSDPDDPDPRGAAESGGCSTGGGGSLGLALAAAVGLVRRRRR